MDSMERFFLPCMQAKRKKEEENNKNTQLLQLPGLEHRQNAEQFIINECQDSKPLFEKLYLINFKKCK